MVMHCEACAAAVRRAIRKIPGKPEYSTQIMSSIITSFIEFNAFQIRQRRWWCLHFETN